MSSLSKRSTTTPHGPDDVKIALTQARIRRIIADETTSDWLKTALQGALQRDPVDSLNDALLLASLLEERLGLLFTFSGTGGGSKEED